MSFRIETREDELLVRIDGTARTELQVLEAVRACKERSWWSCPSGECAKVGTCSVVHDGEALRLHMRPCDGERLSATGIEECLGYVLNQAGVGDS